MTDISLKSVIAAPFLPVHRDIKANGHTHYWLKGGRGSTKSSFVSLEIIIGIMRDKNANCVCIRRFQTNLRESVFEQLKWAIDRLDLNEYFRCHVSPMEIIYIPTGQRIIFRGTDDPTKLKSLKLAKGYVKYVWYEEADQFRGMGEIRTINQSLLRGGSDFVVLYSYNPPASQRNWVNAEVMTERPDRYVHHSTYLDVPREWLGGKFFEEAEYLKETRPDEYRHEYLGEVTGTGREIFTNIKVRSISDDEIKTFDRIYDGLDFGWVDPYAYNKVYYKSNTRELFVFDELHGSRTSNEKLAALIKPKADGRPVICDSAEPKSIADLRVFGVAARGAEKNKGSVAYSFKWLQSLTSITVDSRRCPYTADELLNYEYDIDRDGNIIDAYPDRNDHHLSALRYATNYIWKRRGQ